MHIQSSPEKILYIFILFVYILNYLHINLCMYTIIVYVYIDMYLHLNIFVFARDIDAMLGL